MMAENYSRREIVIGASLIATVGAAEAFVPRSNMNVLGTAKLDQAIPPNVGPWTFISKSGLVVPPADQLRDQLYAQFLTRVYAADDLPPIMLLIAQSPGQDGVLQIHRPEVCYPAGGYTLTNFKVHTIPLGAKRLLPTRFFTAVSADRTEQVLYWTRIGSALPTTWVEQKLAVAKANLKGDIPDAVLTRISTVSADPRAITFLDHFARVLIESVRPKIRSVLIGQSSFDLPAT